MHKDFETAIRGELPALFRVARRLSNCTDDAEDLVQTCLINAFRSWQSFDGRHLRAWLIRILRNVSAASHRGPEPPMQLSDSAIEEPVQDDLWQTVLTRDQASRIFRKIDELEPHHRLVIQLCDVEGMSYEEVAMVLDVPIGTVRSRLFRGRNLLRAAILEEEMSHVG